MKMLTSIVILFAAVVSARADTWSADHAKCYSEMMQFQVLSMGYLSGETKEKTIERLGANGIPALIKKIDLVYGDKPTDFDEYGATIFFRCARTPGLVLDEKRVRACTAENFLVASVLSAKASGKPKDQVIAFHLKCQGFRCKDKNLSVKDIVDELYGTRESGPQAGESRFRRCLSVDGGRRGG